MTQNHTVMVKLNSDGQVQNRIEVHNDNINQFKNLGYIIPAAEGQIIPQSILKSSDQSLSEFDKLEARVKYLENCLMILVKKDSLTFFQRIKAFFKNLF
jgi:hypothetical protein